MKFWKYNLKKLMFVGCMGLMLAVNTVGTRCPGFADDEEFLRYMEEKHKKEGYTTYSSMEEKQAAQGGGNTSTQQQQTPVTEQKPTTTTVNPVKTCKHAYDVKIAREATCDSTGEMVYTCKDCKDSYKEVIAKTNNHVYEEAVTAEPTCTEKGVKTFTCKGCADTYTEEIGVLGHTHESTVTKAATCTEDGELTYMCKNCNDTYTEPVVAMGHTASEWTVTKENSTFAEGLKEQTCITCGTVLGTETIPSKYPMAYLYIVIGMAFVLTVGAVSIIVMRKKK